MTQTITLSKKEMDLINDLLNLTGSEIYQKYGYKRDETITHTAKLRLPQTTVIIFYAKTKEKKWRSEN